MNFTVQIHLDGEWHDAGEIVFMDPDQVIHGVPTQSYDVDYWVDFASVDALKAPVSDRRALSVNFPVDVRHRILDHWPAWLFDIMPQGGARVRIAEDLDLRPDIPGVEVHLLRRAGGAPIGNIRIKEAWEDEQACIGGLKCPPLNDEDIRTVNETFLDVMDRYAFLASGSGGVQGEWPKALMTRSSRDGFWYPDPFVHTDDGVEHVIIKLLKSTSDNDRLIHEAEAPYLEMARAFGLRCASPLRYEPGVLIMPRFDRDVVDGKVLLHGQESFTSALGITAFRARRAHEEYLSVIDKYSDDPVRDRVEYLLRDVLNIAAGNPDNHGRNTALQRHACGGMRMAPLFDFAPMRLSDAGIARQSRWQCLGGNDPGGDWSHICEAVACDGLSADEVRQNLIGKLPQLRALREIAQELAIPDKVIERVFDPERMIRAIKALEDPQCQP